VSRALLLAFLSFAALACHRDADEDLGLAHKEVPALRLDALRDPKALVGALSQPGASVDDKLGARGFELTRTLELKAGERSDLLVQGFRFDADGKGAFHLVHDLDHPNALAPVAARDDGSKETAEKVDPMAQGMEAIMLGGHLYLRPRYGRFIDRRAEPGELPKLRALGERVIADDVELLAPFMSIEERGAGKVLGRSTHKLALSLKPNAHGEKSDDPARAWRASMTVSELSGELELDAETGVPRAAKIDARYRMQRADGAIDVHLSLREDARVAQPITAPDAVPAPRRSHPIVERNQLLEGLAAPAGTQAARAP
jgi:hypothetical protein